ncbi:hypothetical protein LP7551_01774 [Roseibium album]|nr:hypothetical protein LP7551_01774 [Roseibium album]
MFELSVWIVGESAVVVVGDGARCTCAVEGKCMGVGRIRIGEASGNHKCGFFVFRACNSGRDRCIVLSGDGDRYGFC